MRLTSRSVAVVTACLFLLASFPFAGLGPLNGRALPQTTVKNADASTTTTERLPTGTKETTRNEKGDITKEEFKNKEGKTFLLTYTTYTADGTGKRVDSRGVSVGRYENGQIVEARLYFDQNEVMSQLGLLPEPAATTS